MINYLSDDIISNIVEKINIYHIKILIQSSKDFYNKRETINENNYFLLLYFKSNYSIKLLAWLKSNRFCWLKFQKVNTEPS